MMSEAGWECDKVGAPVQFQRSVCFIIAAANREFRLTAGKFVPVCNSTMMHVRLLTVKHFIRIWKSYSKVKCTLLEALTLSTSRTAHRGSRGIILLLLDHGTKRGKGLASGPSRSLPPGKSRWALYRRLGGPQGQPEQLGKNSLLPGFFFNIYCTFNHIHRNFTSLLVVHSHKMSSSTHTWTASLQRCGGFRSPHRVPFWQRFARCLVSRQERGHCL